MITIQIPETHHAGSLGRFIDAYRLAPATPVNTDESMILVEDDCILGYAAYHRQEDEAAVAVLFIAPPMRKMGFGDGLLRALLNLMERNGVRRFVIPADSSVKGFLAAEDLTPCSQPPDWAEATMAEPFWYEGTLPEFFQKPCKGGHR